jgi:hypothetical protein
MNAVPAIPDVGVLQVSVPGDRILLNVSPELTVKMLVTRVERHGEESVSVFGKLVGFVGSSVILVVQGDAVASEITAPQAMLHYKTKYASNGIHFVCKMDDDKYRPCGGGRTPATGVVHEEDWVPEAGEREGIDVRTAGFASRGTCANVGIVFDNMIVYTNVARAAAGGTSAIQAECQLAIDRTNESYENSAINARIRLVRRYEINYDEKGTYNDHLDRISGTNSMGGSTPWTTVRSDRDTFNADFCTLWVDDEEYCGLAWCIATSSARGYQVVTWECAAGNLSHPHEIGHNQGCNHDHDNSGSECSAYDYSHGHRFYGSDTLQYRTVMAYSPGVRIPHFSNPAVSYLGTATGVPGAGSDAARNAETIENRKAMCEGFEVTRWDIWVDFSHGGAEVGTFALPYNTIAEGINNIDNWVAGASEFPNLYIKEGSTNWTGTFNKVMSISSCGGSVTIGHRTMTLDPIGERK